MSTHKIKLPTKSNLCKWGQQWWHEPTSKHHPLKPQCQPIDMNIERQAIDECGYAHVKHEISHPSW